MSRPKARRRKRAVPKRLIPKRGDGKHPLAVYRRQKHLTYPALAALIGNGCSIEAVRSWCQGRRRMKLHAREHIAAITGINVRRLDRSVTAR